MTIAQVYVHILDCIKNNNLILFCYFSGKLAPIFMKGGKTEDCANVSKPSEDPEKTRLRRAFLMSGIPEELKKQTASQAVVVYPESAPLPTVSHVQQRADSSNSTVDVWRLPALNLHLRQLGSITHSHHNWSCLGWKTLVGRDSKHVFEVILKYF